jgi:hypothetical protein
MSPETIEYERQFVKDNYLSMSILDMSLVLKIPFSRVKKRMTEQNLTISKKQIFEIRRKKMQLNNQQKKIQTGLKNSGTQTWVPDPWNKGLNLITMV